MLIRVGRLVIEVQTKDRSSRKLGTISRAFSSFLGNVAAMAASRAFSAIANVFKDFIRGAVDAAGFIQNLEISLETLMAKELAAGVEVTHFAKAVRTLTQAEGERIADLTESYGDMILKHADLTAAIDVNEEKLVKWKDEGKKTEAQVRKLSTAIAIQREKLGDLDEKMIASTGEMETLRAKEGELYTVSYKVAEGTMSIAEAMVQTAGPAKDLIVYLRDLSLISPFEFQKIAEVYQYQMAFGQAAETAKDTTEAILDFAAGSGLTNEEMNRLSYNLAQVGAQSHMTKLDMRQMALTRFTIQDLTKVFDILNERFGTSIENHLDFNTALDSGKIKTQDFYEAFSTYVDVNFGGAAERMGRTVQGVRSNIKDLFYFIGVDLLSPMIEKATEKALELYDVGVKLLEQGAFEKMGEDLLAAFERAFGPGGIFGPERTLSNLILPKGGDLEGADQFIASTDNFLVKLFKLVMSKITGIGEFFVAEIFPRFEEVFELFAGFWDESGDDILTILDGMSGALLDLATTALPILFDLLIMAIEWILPKLSLALRWVVEHWDTFEKIIPFVSAALMGLVNPILGIILFATALYKAWKENWLGVKDITGKTSGTVKKIIDRFVDWIKKAWNWVKIAFNTVSEAISIAWKWLLDEVFIPIWEFIETNLIPIFIRIWDALVKIAGYVANIFANVWDKLLLPILKKIWKYVRENIIPIFLKLWKLFEEYLLPILIDIWEAVRDGVLYVFERLWKFISESLWPLLQDFIDVILDALVRGWNAVASALEAVRDWLKKVSDWFDKMEIPEILQMGSPSPLERSLLNVASALKLVRNESQLTGRALHSAFGPVGGYPMLAGVPGGGSRVSMGGAVHNYYIYDAGAARLAFALADERTERRLDEAMGG